MKFICNQLFYPGMIHKYLAHSLRLMRRTPTMAQTWWRLQILQQINLTWWSGYFFPRYPAWSSSTRLPTQTPGWLACLSACWCFGNCLIGLLEYSIFFSLFVRLEIGHFSGVCIFFHIIFIFTSFSCIDRMYLMLWLQDGIFYVCIPAMAHRLFSFGHFVVVGVWRF